MKEDIYKLELEFDSKMKQLKKKEESLEEDLSYFLQQTDQLKEEVYRMAEGELPAEVYTYFFQMDENSERFRRDVFEQLDQIQDERSKLKWEYDNEIDLVRQMNWCLQRRNYWFLFENLSLYCLNRFVYLYWCWCLSRWSQNSYHERRPHWCYLKVYYRIFDCPC